MMLSANDKGSPRPLPNGDEVVGLLVGASQQPPQQPSVQPGNAQAFDAAVVTGIRHLLEGTQKQMSADELLRQSSSATKPSFSVATAIKNLVERTPRQPLRSDSPFDYDKSQLGKTGGVVTL